jgi:hypothetical protein
MLFKLWHPPSTIISSTSSDKWASQASERVDSARDEDKDVPRSRSKRQELA